MEKYVLKRVKEIMNTDDVKIIKRIEGGMSNYTYIVLVDKAKYTFRIPGVGASIFVDWSEEFLNIEKVKTLSISNQTIYYDINKGEKLSAYVEGIVLCETDILSYNQIAANALHIIHQSSIKFKPYDSFGRLAKYEDYCIKLNHAHPKKYFLYKEKIIQLFDEFKNQIHVACHCDYQPSNLIITNDSLLVLDWEYAGMNDPIYDVASYGSVGFDKAIAFLEAYLGQKPNINETRRLYYYRALQCLQWYNVAIYKDLIGLSKELFVDFLDKARRFLDEAEDLIKTLEKII